MHRSSVSAARAARGRRERSAARPARARRTSAATCTSTRRASDGKATVLEMGRGGAGARLRVPRDLRPHAQRPRRARARRRRRPPPGRGDRRCERVARAVPDPARERVRHPPRRLARPPRRRPRGARVGADQPARGTALGRRGVDRARARGDASSSGVVPLAPEGPDPQPPAGERSRSRPRLRGCARDGRRAGGERPSRPPRPARQTTFALRSPPAWRSSAPPMLTRCEGSGTWSCPFSLRVAAGRRAGQW